ncbi:hypothetical protein RYA05_01755 [Pseudomonas syringae pv. actinidiae]|nr:hypothetical protein [Pseudomonas syringae pv. actinidiae]
MTTAALAPNEIQSVPVTSLNQIRKGSRIIIEDASQNVTDAKVAEIINPQYGHEVIFNRKKNAYFNFQMFLDGQSWVKKLSVVQ